MKTSVKSKKQLKNGKRKRTFCGKSNAWTGTDATLVKQVEEYPLGCTNTNWLLGVIYTSSLSLAPDQKETQAQSARNWQGYFWKPDAHLISWHMELDHVYSRTESVMVNLDYVRGKLTITGGRQQSENGTTDVNGSTRTVHQSTHSQQSTEGNRFERRRLFLEWRLNSETVACNAWSCIQVKAKRNNGIEQVIHGVHHRLFERSLVRVPLAYAHLKSKREGQHKFGW